MKEKEQDRKRMEKPGGKSELENDPENHPEREGQDSLHAWDMNHAGEEFSKIWNKARDSIGDLGRRLKEGARASRHRVEASLLERERRQLLESIGLQVYERMKEAGTEGFPSGIINLCTRIAQLDGMIVRERETAKEHWKEVRTGTGSKTGTEDISEEKNGGNNTV